MTIDKTNVQAVFSKHVMEAYDRYHEAIELHESGLMRDRYEAVRQAFSLAYVELVAE